MNSLLPLASLMYQPAYLPSISQCIMYVYPLIVLGYLVYFLTVGIQKPSYRWQLQNYFPDLMLIPRADMERIMVIALVGLAVLFPLHMLHWVGTELLRIKE